MVDTAEEPFTAVLGFWKGVNLPALQKELDEKGLEIVENQKDSLVSRKKLAEQTREFRKLTDEEKLEQFKSLLKAYQSEIDAITKRTKLAENAFLGVYKTLAEAPDPAPVFEAAVDQTIKVADYPRLQEENETLQRELAMANEQLAKSSDDTAAVSKLQEKLSKLESKSQDIITEKVAENEAAMKTLMDEKIRQYKEREHDLNRQLNQARDELTLLRQTHDSTQAKLIDHSQKYDEEVGAKLAELDIVLMDLERANAKTAELERKNEKLKAEITKLNEGNANSNVTSDSDKISQNEINKLMADVQTYKNLVQSTEARLTKQLSELRKEHAVDELNKTKTKLKEFDDYYLIKRELEIMKYVEFSTGDDDEVDFDAEGVLGSSANGASGVGKETLEVLAMEKNKKLQSQVTELNVTKMELQEELQRTQKALQMIEEKNTTQEALILRLEEDLGRLNTSYNNAQASPNGSLLPLPADTASARPSIESVRGPSSDDKSILPIITGQRDRFRQRNAELEEELRQKLDTIQDLRGEVDTLRKDNLKLYERLKFVHVYREQKEHSPRSNYLDSNDVAASPYRSETAATSSSIPMGTLASTSRRGVSDDPADKYSKMYEESMNPFTEFHRREESRRYNSMNPADKFTLGLTKLMFASKWSRLIFVGYSLLLHLLVLATLYKLSLWEECRHDHEFIMSPQLNEFAAANGGDPLGGIAPQGL